MSRHRLAATLFLVVLAAAPLALAQGKPKKKGAKPAASASASVTEAAPAPPPPPAPEPAPEPSAAPATSSSAELPSTPPEGESVGTETREDGTKTYMFIGARYRGTLIPQFLVNAFVRGGSNFYSNLAALELDIRKDHHSIIPWLGFATYGFGNTLFENDGGGKGPEYAGNWTVVNSSLNAIYLGLDELWSTPLDEAHHWDFEYGFGFGLGVVFGNLGNNWVHTKTGSQISDSNYVPCATVNDGTGCALGDHTNATTAKVGNFQEGAGLLGPKPILFPYLAVPQLGVRFKPAKQFEARFGLGFSLTGFWFGISGDYGLEPMDNEAPSKKAGGQPSLHGML